MPAPLVAIGEVALAVWALGVPVDTLSTRFHTGGREIAGIPTLPPLPQLPWGDGALTMRLIEKLFPSAFTIATSPACAMLTYNRLRSALVTQSAPAPLRLIVPRVLVWPTMETSGSTTEMLGS